MPSNILLVRLSAIGDIVMASPLIDALHRAYPQARISWLVQPETRDLLSCHAHLHEVIIWPRRDWQALNKAGRWLDLFKAINAFRAELRSRGFDLAIDMQGLLKSGFLTWLSGARERIGLGSREGSGWLMSRVIERGVDSKRIGSEYLHLARQLGLPTDGFEMHIGLSQEDEVFAADLINREGLGGGYAVICPFTTRPQKHWIEGRWLELTEGLNTALDLPVVMLGGPGDVAAAGRIAGDQPGQPMNQVGVTSLRQAAALIKHSSLLIGVDTGLTHMGIAFSRPTLCLFGSTCPYLDTTHDNARVIYHQLECSPCKRKPTCDGRFDCMRAIAVDEVLQQAGRLLQLESGAI